MCHQGPRFQNTLTLPLGKSRSTQQGCLKGPGLDSLGLERELGPHGADLEWKNHRVGRGIP